MYHVAGVPTNSQLDMRGEYCEPSSSSRQRSEGHEQRFFFSVIFEVEAQVGPIVVGTVPRIWKRGAAYVLHQVWWRVVGRCSSNSLRRSDQSQKFLK